MSSNKQPRIAVIIVNWNGEEDSLACIDGLKKQSIQHNVIAVDNGSTDSFCETMEKDYPEILLLKNKKNLGFAGGVNTGIKRAIVDDYKYIALVNNDAVPNPEWLEELVKCLDDEEIGLVTGKLLKTDGLIDSTGDEYTSWGLAYPRSRNEKDKGQYDNKELVFAATGGASLYRTKMLKEIGLFDEDFFAYYEDVDLSFRAQIAGWKVSYTPEAVAYHKIGASSEKIPGFTTYMTIKNLPWLFWKNVPMELIPTILPRFIIAYFSIVMSSLFKGKFIPVVKGLFYSILLLPKKLVERHKIQSNPKKDPYYIKMMITYDLPPNSYKLKKIRNILRRLRFWK